MPDVGQLTVQSGGPLRGRLRVPGDKSISHRSLLLGSVADGASTVAGFLPSGDCLATLSCIRALGVRVERDSETSLTVYGRGLRGLRRPDAALNCVRSGTTMRLLAGVLAGQSFDCVLSGDPQLLRRPMLRIAEPLSRMGAAVETVDGHGPLTVRGRIIRAIDLTLPVASAQVKSAILLAGMHAEGLTTVRQPGPARDHTERMMAAMGANLCVSGLTVELRGPACLHPLALRVPADISSAAFPLVAALLVPGSVITLVGLGINPTRTGLLDVLRAMGADILIEDARMEGPEPTAEVTARASPLTGAEVGGETVVRMIDELPALAVAATQARGTTLVRNAEELRVKETDRIATVVAELRSLGASIEARADGFVVEGPTALRGTVVHSHGDHRLAMALAVAGLVAHGETVIRGAGCIDDSFPGFVPLMRAAGASYD